MYQITVVWTNNKTSKYLAPASPSTAARALLEVFRAWRSDFERTDNILSVKVRKVSHSAESGATKNAQKS